MNKQILTGIVSVLIGTGNLFAQNIASIRLAALNSTVTIKGVVTNGSELGNIRYVQDSSAGISIYGSNLSTINRGDSVVATGILTNYNNLLEITPVSNIVQAATNITLPTPQVITNVSTLNDSYESEVVQINSCVFANGGANFAGNTNYNVTTGTQTFEVRILTGSLLVGAVIPTGNVNLTGILSQYCTTPTTGCTTGYQLILRDINDLQNSSSIYLINSTSTSNITTTAFDINWTTNITGTNSFVKYGLTPNLELGIITASNATTHAVTLTGLTPATIYYVKAYSVNNTDTATTLIKPFCTQSLSNGAITAYFNRAVDNSVSSGVNAIQLNYLIADTLAAYINRVQNTLDICIYNWDNSSNGMKIVNAVNAAHTRGVKIRLIYDGSTTNSAVGSLNSQIKKVASPQGSSYTIMHNKFVIMDVNSTNPNVPVLWTGSTNWTSNQLTTDANNVIIFQDQSITRGYKLEFDEMWGDSSQTSLPNTSMSKFGQYKTDNTPHEYIIGGKRVESYFSPSDQTNSKILATIATANNDIYFCQYVTTRSDIANQIKNQIINNSLLNKGIIDDSSSSATPYNILKPTMGNNLALYKHGWLLHHKYLIVDQSNSASDPLVLTGSHNWSNAGDQKNDENTVVVHDGSIANQYYQDFMGRWCEKNGASCALSVSEIENNHVLEIYPNPNNGNFLLLMESEGTEKSFINLFDITGKCVYTKQEQIVNGSNKIEIKTNQLSKGLYLLHVITNNRQYAKKILIE